MSNRAGLLSCSAPHSVFVYAYQCLQQLLFICNSKGPCNLFPPQYSLYCIINSKVSDYCLNPVTVRLTWLTNLIKMEASRGN